MKTPDNNPYSEFSSPASNPTEKNKGSKVKGFLIGWVLIIFSYVFSACLLFVLDKEFRFSFDELANTAIACLFLPLLFNGLMMLWHGLEGQRKTVIGNAISLISLIAAMILLVAACFSMM